MCASYTDFAGEPPGEEHSERHRRSRTGRAGGGTRGKWMPGALGTVPKAPAARRWTPPWSTSASAAPALLAAPARRPLAAFPSGRTASASARAERRRPALSAGAPGRSSGQPPSTVRRSGRPPVTSVVRAASMLCPRYQSPVWSRL